MKNPHLDLLKKYDVAIPRYTSYPTVPFWELDTLNAADLEASVRRTFHEENGRLSIYIHLPFCEQLCTFCACNKRITKNHSVEGPYIDSLLAEWRRYLRLFDRTPVIGEIHLGGGTPSFFAAEQLERLISGICRDAVVPDDREFSIEVHPNYTKEEQLRVLGRLGFNRISIGVQDFDPVVQFAINRIQSVEQTARVVEWSRQRGLDSVNIDLVYGLPHQTTDSIEHSIDQIEKLKPQRIAYYSYAHVPWKSKGQRRYTEQDLPAAADKMNMYLLGRRRLVDLGYAPVGMDHFARADDALAVAFHEGKMHRNFMGYTTTQNKLIAALGCSAISDSWTAFAQNEKTVEDYQQGIAEDRWPLVNGHKLNTEDLVIRQKILSLMCQGQAELHSGEFEPGHEAFIREKWAAMQADGLLDFDGERCRVTDTGQIFIRNISAVLDARLWRKGKADQLFSKAI